MLKNLLALVGLATMIVIGYALLQHAFNRPVWFQHIDGRSCGCIRDLPYPTEEQCIGIEEGSHEVIVIPKCF